MKYTTDQLLTMHSIEIEKYGKHVWSDKRKTIEEILKIKGVKIPN